MKTIVINLKVEDNHLVLDISENDFIDSGIPKPYYDLYQEELRNTNHFIDSMHLQGVDSILKESYKDLYLKFKSKQN